MGWRSQAYPKAEPTPIPTPKKFRNLYPTQTIKLLLHVRFYSGFSIFI